MTLILGIDPGLRHTGWGIIRYTDNRLSYIACGTLSTTDKAPLPERLVELHHGLQDVIASYRPDVAAVEETFVNTNALSSLKLGHARGTLMVCAALAHLPVHEYATRLVKKSVVGVGNADKDQISTMVKHLLPMATIPSADAADALAVAICHAHHSTLRQWQSV